MSPLSLFVSVLLFLNLVYAQGGSIGYPPPGTTVQLGQQLTVQLVRPVCISSCLPLQWTLRLTTPQLSHQGSREAGLVIGITACPSAQCPSPSQEIGQILYNGPFNPALQEQPGRPYQNFTITVPSDDYYRGTLQIATARFHLIGVSKCFS